MSKWRDRYQEVIEGYYGSDYPDPSIVDRIMSIAGEFAIQQLTSTLNEVADLRHQLDAANLKLTSAALKLQLVEENLAGMKITQKSQHDALRAIRGVILRLEEHDDIYSGGQLESINEILKGLEL